MPQTQTELSIVINRLGRAARALPRTGKLLPAAAGTEPGLNSEKY